MSKTLVLLLSLLFAQPSFAALDFNGSTDKIVVASVVISAAPMTVCAWIKPTSVALDHGVWTVSDTGTNSDSFRIDMTNTSDLIRWIATRSSGGTASTSPFLASVWQHVCGRETSITSRHAFLNGVAGTEDTTSITPTAGNLDTTSMGVRKRLAEDLFFSGTLAEISVWNRALSNAEILSLSIGYSPNCYRNGMVQYTRLMRDAQDAKGTVWTTTGTTVATHPRIIYCH